MECCSFHRAHFIAYWIFFSLHLAHASELSKLLKFDSISDLGLDYYIAPVSVLLNQPKSHLENCMRPLFYGCIRSFFVSVFSVIKRFPFCIQKWAEKKRKRERFVHSILLMCLSTWIEAKSMNDSTIYMQCVYTLSVFMERLSFTLKSTCYVSLIGFVPSASSDDKRFISLEWIWSVHTNERNGK